MGINAKVVQEGSFLMASPEVGTVSSQTAGHEPLIGNEVYIVDLH